ncbi:hypothetical protein TNCV_1481111 [Trichonephila clavipes]|nr:hypothetical protein TNCV_1481111 [Trichonephila clavipes]
MPAMVGYLNHWATAAPTSHKTTVVVSTMYTLYSKLIAGDAELWAMGSLVVRALDFRPEGLGSMPDASKYPPSAHESHGKIVEVEIGGVSIYRSFGEFCRANSYCHLYGKTENEISSKSKFQLQSCEGNCREMPHFQNKYGRRYSTKDISTFLFDGKVVASNEYRIVIENNSVYKISVRLNAIKPEKKTFANFTETTHKRAPRPVWIIMSDISERTEFSPTRQAQVAACEKLRDTVTGISALHKSLHEMNGRSPSPRNFFTEVYRTSTQDMIRRKEGMLTSNLQSKITSIADVSCTPIGPPLPKSRPPLLTQVSNTMSITVPDSVEGCWRSLGTSTQNQPQFSRFDTSRQKGR